MALQIESKPTTFTSKLPDGSEMIFETGEIAKQAGGSCIVRMGDTMVLCNATASMTPREGMNFFPLTVEYKEMPYAGGKIPGVGHRRALLRYVKNNNIKAYRTLIERLGLRK